MKTMNLFFIKPILMLVFSISLHNVSNAQCITPPSNMVMWLDGDDVSNGTANDIEVAGNNDGTLTGGATTDVNGKVSHTFNFNGSTSFISVSDHTDFDFASTGEFSVDCWVKLVDLGAHQGIISHVDGGTYGKTPGWAVAWHATFGFRFMVGTKDSYGLNYFETGKDDYLVNTWYLITMTSDGSTLRGYVNKTEVGFKTITNYGDVGTDLHIGKGPVGVSSGSNSWQADKFFDGFIDEVEVFNKKLSSAEIENIYNAGTSGKCKSCVTAPSNMVMWLDGDDVSNGTANDIEVAGNNDGTLTGGATTDVNGKVSHTFNFNGSTSFISVSDHTDFDFASTGEFSVDCWVKLVDLGAHQGIISHVDGGTYGKTPGWAVAWHATFGFRFMVGTKDSYGLNYFETGKDDYLVNTWYLITMTSDGSTLRGYVNKTEVGFKTITNYGDVGTDLHIGKGPVGVSSGSNSWQADKFFDGFIDEVEVFNKKLSSAEIENIYNAGTFGKCKPGGSKTQIEETLGITTNNELKQLFVVPNPNKGHFQIHINEQTMDEAIFFQIIDVTGKLVLEVNKTHISNGIMSIDISNQPEGMYFVRIVTPKKVFIEKIITN